jgi:hypothetical protein
MNSICSGMYNTVKVILKSIGEATFTKNCLGTTEQAWTNSTRALKCKL